MSLAVYKQFLAEPSSSLLADHASLHYITTTTSFRGAAEVIKHLSSLRNQVKKKSEDVISAVEGQAAIAVEIDTSITFQTSGGAYMPGIDEAFLINVTARLPIMHVVTFDEHGKITQIRQQWDQGSLLKKLDLIGKSGRNWPIGDSKAQIALIQSCLKSQASSSSPSSPSPDAQSKDDSSTPAKSRAGASSAPRDPNASLHMFAAERVDVVSPYAGKRPVHRSHTDFLSDNPICGEANPFRNSPAKAGLRAPQPNRIFGGHESDPSENHANPFHNSPAKAGLREPQRNRLFDAPEPVEPVSDEKPKPKAPHIRAHPTRYEHFEFADGSDENRSAPTKEPPPFPQSPYSKRDSSWSFADFTSPVKTIPSKGMRKQEPNEWDAYGRVMPHQAAEPFISKRSTGTFRDSEETLVSGDVGSAGALGDITNTQSRANDLAEADSATQTIIDAVKELDISGKTGAEEALTPRASDNGENDKHMKDSGIRVAGDGMGSRAGGRRDFLYGGDDGEDTPQAPRPKASRYKNPATQSSLWDIM